MNKHKIKPNYNNSKIRSVFRYVSNEDRERFKQSRCLLTISVGQEAHEAEKFSATVDLVNASFGSVILIIGDSLQRHTMALHSQLDEDQLYALSIEAGNQWLERNKPLYEKLDILEKIIRWDDLLENPNYFKRQQEIQTLLKHDASYRDAFSLTVEDFLAKNLKHISLYEQDIQKDRQLCFNYLTEECAVFCLWSELEGHFEVYPSRRNVALAETYKRLILPNYPHLLHAVGIKFKNSDESKPQDFSILKNRRGH